MAKASAVTEGGSTKPEAVAVTVNKIDGTRCIHLDIVFEDTAGQRMKLVMTDREWGELVHKAAQAYGEK